MIASFGNQLAEDFFGDRKTAATKRFSSELRRVVRGKLLYLHDSETLIDLKVPPGNRLEAFKGDRKGHFSTRINDQWRLVFRWADGNAHDVKILDHHK